MDITDKHNEILSIKYNEYITTIFNLFIFNETNINIRKKIKDKIEKDFIKILKVTLIGYSSFESKFFISLR
tara:strand:+ start:108 stop:320 length:213 start_codon:yes stop_codon:yes gene_type:complete